MLDVDSRRFSSAKLASGSKTLAIGFIKPRVAQAPVACSIGRASDAAKASLHASGWGSAHAHPYAARQHPTQSMPPRRRQQRKVTAAPPAATSGAPRPAAAPSEDALLQQVLAESRRAAAAAPLSEEAELQRALAMSAQSYTAEQSQRKAYERYAAPAGAVQPARAPQNTPPPRAPRHTPPPRAPLAAADLAPLHALRTRAEQAVSERRQREARLAELARRPPAIQAAPDVARLMDELGLSRFLPLLLAEEVEDMDTLRLLEARELKDLLLPLGARTKLLHALKREPGWRPRHTR